ncbi:MAG: SDR family oxidoreductase [Streptomycetales bacterium]
MYQTFFSSLLEIFQPQTMLLLMGGIAIGFVVGVLPGLGGSVTLALMLPFTDDMEPVPVQQVRGSRDGDSRPGRGDPAPLRRSSACVRGSCVNTVTPDRVGSPVGEGEEPADGRRTNLLGRGAVPDDVANALALLASYEAGFITAADLLVDGGSLYGGVAK